MIRRIVALLIVVLLCFALLFTPAWATDKFTWPIVGEVIKHFDPDAHRGIDIAGSAGTSIMAAQDGVVYWIGKTPRGEPCISIDHPGGLTTTYLPVTASVSKGQSVKAGDVIGAMSSEIDKSSSEQHLHFGVFETATRDAKKYLDPSNYLPDISSKVEDKHESVAPIEASTGSNAGKLPGSQGQSTGDVEVHPAITEQPQQRVAISTPNVIDKPAENIKADAQPPLGTPSVKVEERVAPGVAVSQGNANVARQVHINTSAKSDSPPWGQMLASNGVSQDTAMKVGLPNLSRVAPEVKPDLITAVSYGTHTIKTASAQAPREPTKTAGECTKNRVSAIKGSVPIKSTTSTKKAGASQPVVNPFEHVVNAKYPTGHVQGKTQPSSRATKSSYTWAQRFLNWQFLPTTTLALALLLIAILSYQCVRNARRIGPSLFNVASPSC